MAEAEQKAHRKSKSVQKKPAIFQRFGPMTAQENQHFEELYKKTLKDIHVANREYTQQKLLQKIKENGSLYAVPSTNESSNETEMRELIAKMEPVIAKPDKFLKDQQITDLYKSFREEIQKIQEEENAARKMKEEAQKKAQQPDKGAEQGAATGLSQMPGGARKGKDAKKGARKAGDLDIDSDYEEVMQEQIDTISDHSPSK